MFLLEKGANLIEGKHHCYHAASKTLAPFVTRLLGLLVVSALSCHLTGYQWLQKTLSLFLSHSQFMSLTMQGPWRILSISFQRNPLSPCRASSCSRLISSFLSPGWTGTCGRSFSVAACRLFHRRYHHSCQSHSQKQQQRCSKLDKREHVSDPLPCFAEKEGFHMTQRTSRLTYKAFSRTHPGIEIKTLKIRRFTIKLPFWSFY